MARKNKDWIESYLKYTEHTEAPEKFHFWSAVWTIAAVLERRSWIDMGPFVWFPNFYVIFVGPAGVVKKSSTSAIGKNMLDSMGYTKFGAETGTWQGIIQQMQNVQEQAPVGDGYVPQSPLSIQISELGTFLNPKDNGQMSSLIKLWDGESTFTKHTMTEGEVLIEGPWLNLIGGTTESWIAENLSHHFHSGGLASRIIFVYSDEIREPIPYPFLRMDEDYTQLYRALVDDLEEIHSICGPFELSKGAIELGEDWYHKHCERKNTSLSGEQFQGFLARKQAHIHKLAMVISAAQKDNRVINEHDLRRAIKAIDALEQDMPRVYDEVGRDQETITMDTVRTTVEAEGKITKIRLYRRFSKKLSFENFERILNSLIKAEYLKQRQQGNSLYIYPVKEDSKEE